MTFYGNIINPCSNGHVFTWASSSTKEGTSPPPGTHCLCGLTRWSEHIQKQLLYTVGNSEQYFSYIEEDPDAAKGVGGSVWKTIAEAAAHLNPQLSIFGVYADWGVDTEPDEDGDWHRLLVDAPLVVLFKV